MATGVDMTVLKAPQFLWPDQRKLGPAVRKSLKSYPTIKETIAQQNNVLNHFYKTWSRFKEGELVKRPEVFLY